MLGRMQQDRHPAPTASVAVVTRNRAPHLDRCLASLAASVPDDVEVLVVDNGSTDGTAAVVARWQGRMPNLRSLVEPEPGASRARNLALRRAKGDVVAFTDDDNRATPAWLPALLDAYRPGVVAAGGPVVLEWPGGRPTWVAPSVERWWSGLDLGPERRRLGPDDELFGCNLSVRRELALSLGGFDLRLGRVGRRLRSGDDWDLQRRLHRAGGEVLYVPAATVIHDVLPERRRFRWLLRRAFDQGGSDATRALAVGPDGASVASAFRRGGRHLVVAARELASGRQDGALLAAVEAVRSSGEAWGRALSRGRGAGPGPRGR
jgi:glycosyltransferase involved in cell wall biosynthesis